MQRYCSEACQAEAKRARTMHKNNLFKIAQPLMEIQHQEYLTFSKATTPMGCSRQYIYKLVESDKLKKLHIIHSQSRHRADAGKQSLLSYSARQYLYTEKVRFIFCFSQKEKREEKNNEVLDFYSTEDVMSLYKVKQSWLYT